MLPDSILRVIPVSGGIIVDGSKVLPDTIIKMVATASIAGVTITIRNADSLLPDTAMKIANAGKRNVIYDFS